MSPENHNKFYITTPIYYVNARPHIGHAYTTIVCDAVARRQRMLGRETFFLTGTDEYGVNVERSAVAAGKDPQVWSDEVSATFRALFDKLGLTYNDFIRTTEPRHRKGVQELFRRIRDNGYIYKGSYSGQYCVFDNLFVDVTEPGAPCPECGRPTETVKEENYFFKLSAFEDKLLKLYADHPDFIRPESRRNEVAAFVRTGLRDLSISRSTFKWGVPVPDDPDHVIYVWLDALSNYITALGFGTDDPADKARFEKFWPADVQVIGKEIVRFHCVYWPAFLMAAGLPLPKSIIAHGWLLFEESKMSKSRGNIVRADTVSDVMGADALRYFLLREVVFGQDGSFSFDALVQRYNSDLANGVGNLASRTLTMIGRYFQGEIPANTAPHLEEAAIAETARQTIAQFSELFDQFHFSRALEALWALVAAINKYIVDNEPWALGEKTDPESRHRLATILYTSAETLRIVTALLYAAVPTACEKIWAQLGLGEITKFDLTSLAWGQLEPGSISGKRIGTIEGVFPRAGKEAIHKMQHIEEEKRQAIEAEKVAAAVTNAVGETTVADNPVAAPSDATSAELAAADTAAPNAIPALAQQITIDDFLKIDLRVGQIKVAERIKGSDKLLRLEVDIGLEVRQVLAGIAEHFDPATLVGRRVAIVANLAPRKMRGLESNGMIVAASLPDGPPSLVAFLDEVPLGARLK